jgi:hypothetical protein
VVPGAIDDRATRRVIDTFEEKAAKPGFATATFPHNQEKSLRLLQA